MAKRTVGDRFWSKVDKAGECWVWTAARYSTGYGMLSVDGRVMMAHRYAWAAEHGPIPVGLCVLHRCDNPPCVRLTHLFLGTQQANLDDMFAKGRHRVRCGEAHADAKLTAEAVRFIRKSTAGHREIAKRFGVSEGTVRDARARRTWKHVV